MGATQGSAGSEPREPAAGAEQVGSLPVAHRAPPPAALPAGTHRPGRAAAGGRGGAPRPGRLASRGGGCEGGGGREGGGASMAWCEERVRVCNAYLQVLPVSALQTPLIRRRLQVGPGPPAFQAEKPLL